MHTRTVQCNFRFFRRAGTRLIFSFLRHESHNSQTMLGANRSSRKLKNIRTKITPTNTSSHLNLTALPSEVLLHIFAFSTHQDLLQARLVNSQFKEFLSCLHFVSTREALQQLFDGQLDDLLATYSICPTAHTAIVQDLLSDRAFRDFLSQHRENDPVTCGRHALLHGFRKYYELEKIPGETHEALLERIRHPWNRNRKRPERELNPHFRDHGLPPRFSHFYISADMWRYVMPDSSDEVEALMGDALRHWNIEAAIDLLNRKLEQVGPTFYDMKTSLYAKLFILRRSITYYFSNYPNPTWKLLMSPHIRQNGQCTRPYQPINIRDLALKKVVSEQLTSGKLPLELPHVQLVCWLLLCEYPEAAELLMNHPASNLSLYHHYPLLQFLNSRMPYDPDTYRKIVQDPRIDLSSVGSIILENVVIGGDLELAEYLLHHPNIDATPNGNELFFLAVKSDNHQLIQLILDDPRIDPHANDNEFFKGYFFYSGVSDQSIEKLEFLTQHPRVDLNSLHSVFRFEFLDGLYRLPISTLSFLISHFGVDPGAENNEALQYALSFDSVQKPLVEWLLNHPKVDPAANDNEIFLETVMQASPSFDAVQYLLACPCIDPSARDNAAFFYVFSKLYPTFKPDFFQYRSASYKFPSSHLKLKTIRSINNYYILVGRQLLKVARVMDKLRLKYPHWDTYGIKGSVLDESVHQMAESPDRYPTRWNMIKF